MLIRLLSFVRIKSFAIMAVRRCVALLECIVILGLCARWHAAAARGRRSGALDASLAAMMGTAAGPGRLIPS